MDYEKYRPNDRFSNVSQIDFARLFRLGLSYYIFDLDDTLAEPGEDLDLSCCETIINARKSRQIQKMIIVSNIWIGWPSLSNHVSEAAFKLDCPYIAACWPHMKPKSQPFLSAMDIMGSRTTNTAIVGDRLKTDIYGGNRLGLYTILVNPLSSESIRTAGKRAKERKIMDHLGLPHRL